MTATDTAARPSWREEVRRRDREDRARLEREARASRTADVIARQEAAASLKREADDYQRERRAEADAARSARLAALSTWVSRHVTDLLLVPVIVVPAVLAWTAMAAYGAHLYGPEGRALPAFSEFGAWAFAAAVTITRHRHPERPTWRLRLGIVVFAAFGAVLNFAHGLTTGGPVTGAVMAVISVAGVTAHQLTKAGPAPRRRTLAERDADRIDRLAARRLRAARTKAVKDAVVELDSTGSARLVYPAAAPAPVTAPTPPAPAPRARKRAAKPAAQPGTRADSTAERIAQLRAAEPGISPADIAARLNLSPRTVRRYPPAAKPGA